MGEIRINNILYSTPIQKVTQAEYDALGDAKNTNGVLYAITDGESSSGGGTSKPVELTRAQYEALGDSVLTDGILYAITDGEDLTAKNLAYDGSATGLGSTVQEAIDEQNKNLEPVLLWENPNPKSSFSPVTLNINWEIYKKIGIECTYNTANTTSSRIFEWFTDSCARILCTIFVSPYGNAKGRDVEFGDGTIKFCDGHSASTAADNAAAIPLRIFGYHYR